MTKQPSQYKKLEALIQKAIESGWKHSDGWTYINNYEKPAPFNSVQFVDRTGEIWHIPVQVIIFDHDFVRALFGKENWMFGSIKSSHEDYIDRKYDYWYTESERKKLKPAIWYVLLELQAWEYHLQQAVISNDPIGYMYKTVFPNNPS